MNLFVRWNSVRSLSAFISIILLGCSSDSATSPTRVKLGIHEIIGDAVGLDVSGLDVFFKKNTYSDFALQIPGGLTDGEMLVALRVNANAAKEFGSICSQSVNWKRLPLSPELEGGEQHLRNSWPSELQPFDTKQGYYFFVDRYEGEDHRKLFHERASENFTLAVYDEEFGILYFHSSDS